MEPAEIQNTLRRSTARYKLIDLFCGTGGITRGFTEKFGQPAKPDWACDFNG